MIFSEVNDKKYLDFIAHSQIAMALETENLALNVDTVKKGVQHLYNTPELGKYYVCLDDDRKPMACLLTTYEWSDWRNAKCLWIQSVYVLPQYRSRGIFKFMYLELKKLVNNSDEYSGLRLYVDKTNTLAQNVYQKVGMSNEHYELYEWLKDS